jgi:hypothetical protein
MKTTTTQTNAGAATTAQPAWAKTELPINTLERCMEVAIPMFADSAVVSVNVQATFGLVEVSRYGQGFAAQEVAA